MTFSKLYTQCCDFVNTINENSFKDNDGISQNVMLMKHTHLKGPTQQAAVHTEKSLGENNVLPHKSAVMRT